MPYINGRYKHLLCPQRIKTQEFIGFVPSKAVSRIMTATQDKNTLNDKKIPNVGNVVTVGEYRCCFLFLYFSDMETHRK